MTQLSQLANLGVSFVNTDPNTNIDFDRIWITVTLKPTVSIYRWANVTVLDSQGLPVSGATVDPTTMLQGEPAQYYSASGVSTVPPAEVLAYLGKTAGNYLVTNSAGSVIIPLLSEFINDTSMPNSNVVGDYLLTAAYINATFVEFDGYAGVSFTPYPAMGVADQTVDINIVIDTLILDRPDLTPTSLTTLPATVYINDMVTVSAVIADTGLTGANSVFVQFYDGGQLISNYTIPSIAPSGSEVATVQWNAFLPGMHTITVVVDPLNAILEKSKTNNERSIQVNVLLNLPDLAITSASISFSPQPAWTHQPVTAFVNVSNIGRMDAINVTVAYYVGDPASVGQLIGTSLVNVSQGATVQTHLTWQPSQIGTYDIYVVVNPAKDIPEYSYANNEASASITVNLTILQFDVVVDGTNTFVFSDPTFNLRGNIIVKDSGTLIIDSSTLVIFQHQDEEFQIYVMDSGTFEMRNSTLTSNYQITMNLLDDGALTMTHSTISAMVKTIADDDSTVVATNSNIGGDVVAPSTSSAVLDIRYSVMSQPLTDFGGNSQATLVSVSVPAAQPKENAIVYNFRTINVLVNDGAGNPLPGADVSVWWYSNKTLYTSGITGASGTISFPALSDVITAFSSNFFGNYLVNATFSTYMSGKAIAALLPYSEPLNVADVSLTLTVGPALPALSIAASDISLSPALLYTGQIAVVNATVHNGGVVDARNVLVRLFADGLPVVDVVLADVPAGGSAVASFSWVPALPGDHELIVLVNANNAIPETDYSNNFASVTAHVEVSTAPADLVVEGNMVVTLNGTTFTYSKVVVRGNGQLFITNGGLNINQPVPGSFSIFVQDNGQLNIANAAINSNQQIWMQVSGSAKVNIQSSLVFFTVGLRLEGSSSVYVESSTIGSDVVAPTGSAATLKARNTTFLSAWSSFGGDAKAYLTNVTIPKIALTGNAIAYNYRWIAVTVVDGTNAALPNATVLLKWYVNGTVAGTKISDSQGKALFEALGDILTPTTAPAFYGNYKVNATFVFEGQSFNVSWTPVSLDPYSEPLSPLSKAVTLKVDGARPDLDPPLLVNPPSPFKGDNVTLTSIVKNVGVVPARNVIVRFTDDTNIVADVIIPKIVPHQIVQVSTIWVPQTLGVHNVSVILDPVGAIPELNKNNNVNWTLVNVRGKPDLAFSASDIVITPSSPVTNSSATISVTVINQGDASAVGAIVRFLQTPPGGAIRFIGNNTLSTMAAGESRTSVMSFGPTAPGTYMITIRVSVPGQPDKNVSVPLTVRDYPDLAATAIDLSPSSVNVGDQLTMSATVTNVGQSSASNVLVYFWLGNTGTGTLIDQTTIPLINAGETLQAVGQWIVTANSAGKIQTRTVTVQVDPFNAIRKIGHAVGVFSLSFDVLDMRPDLAFSSNVTVVGGATPITEAPIGQNVTISVDVHNSGYSAANNVMIEFRINDADNLNRTIGSLTHTIMANQTYEASIAWVVDAAGPGNFTLWVTLDPLHLIDEVSTTNNVAHTNFTIKPADVSIDVTLPSGTDYQQGSNIFITGYIKNQRTLSPLVNRTVSVFITDLSGQTQYGVMVSTMSTSLGWYGVSVHVPDTLDQGAYNLKVIVDMGTTHPSSQAQISVSPAAVETSMPFWVWLVIILAVVAIILFFSIYLYRYGLGKMVECGECGALIPESSKRCPKCGTQFETGTAKCSQCSAWIPVTSTECPECGAKFVAGPIAEEEDEHVKAMRQQYEVFVDTYREQAKGVLGKKFNEKRFMEWWKNQPSYISFERWLSQEDEKRAVATSITCPTCGTLNPRDSTICQKCGTVFDQKPAAPEAAAEEQRPLRRIVRRPAEKKLIPRKEAKPEEQAPQQPAQPSEPQGPEQPKNP
ncbi:MAG TPA: CARDB domain-containing protein [Methanomassiliicoccales archaeon]|nr:CARDB domain-containing protein [Methanomassiliicoccales archaeon]